VLLDEHDLHSFYPKMLQSLSGPLTFTNFIVSKIVGVDADVGVGVGCWCVGVGVGWRGREVVGRLGIAIVVI
jgi:hypothetical protein